MVLEDGSSTITERQNADGSEKYAGCSSSGISATTKDGTTSVRLPDGSGFFFPAALAGSLHDILTRVM